MPSLHRKLTVAVLSGAMLLSGMASAATQVSLWYHTGRGEERDAFMASVKTFNSKNKDVKIKVVQLPEGSYTDQVNAAALANKLPCMLDFDGPNVYNYAWTGKIIPLDGFPEIKAVKSGFTKTIIDQGTYNGKLYSLGQFDSGLAIWGNKKLLNKAGIRIPTSVKNAWTLKEFENALKKLKANGVPFPLDMKFNYGLGEWLSYGFSPIVQSFGGDLINRKTYMSAEGVLNGPAAVKAMKTVQNWVKKGYVNRSVKTDTDFVQGKSALSYVGHWAYPEYSKALGNNLILLPMPKFGKKQVTGAGSWNWGISKNCKVPKAAARVLAYLVSKEEVARMTNANGAVPSIQSAIASSKAFAPGGPLRIYVDQIEQGVAVVRPQTPAYPAISTAFAEAVNSIVSGADVKKELDKAVKKIDQVIEDNQGYPVK